MFFQSVQSKRRTIWFAATAAMLGVTPLLLHAFNPQPDPPKVFGVFGITAADVIRLNVTNVATEVGAVGAFAPPCRAHIGFVNADGAVLKSADVSIADGHTASLALTFFEASALEALVPRARIMVRPIIQLPPPCFTAVSAEVGDANNGRVNIYATPQVWTAAPAVTTNLGQ